MAELARKVTIGPYVIERGVPVSRRVLPRSPIADTVWKLEAAQSFLVPLADLGRARNAASRCARRTGRRFVCRKVDAAFGRVWRTR